MNIIDHMIKSAFAPMTWGDVLIMAIYAGGLFSAAWLLTIIL